MLYSRYIYIGGQAIQPSMLYMQPEHCAKFNLSRLCRIHENRQISNSISYMFPFNDYIEVKYIVL